jgi:hypothetical protein
MGRSDSRPRPWGGLCIPHSRCRRPEGSECGACTLPLTPVLPHAATWGHSAHPDPLPAASAPRRVSQVPARSVGTRPPQSPRVAQRVSALIATPLVSDFASSGKLVTTIGLTRPNRVHLRWARTSAVQGGTPPFARRPCGPQTGSLSPLGYPHGESRDFVLNEQLSRLTPFSQQDRASLSWRTRR